MRMGETLYRGGGDKAESAALAELYCTGAWWPLLALLSVLATCGTARLARLEVEVKLVPTPKYCECSEPANEARVTAADGVFCGLSDGRIRDDDDDDDARMAAAMSIDGRDAAEVTLPALNEPLIERVLAMAVTRADSWGF